MIGNLTDIDNMYKDYRLLKKPAHYEYTDSEKRYWVPAKYRKISAPAEELKAEQRRILREILSKILIHDCAYGFVEGRNIFDNAKAHLGAESILELDLKDFFDTINAKRVFHALKRNGVSEKQARYITRIATRYGLTPQGAPTSPAISNIVCKPMDRYIMYLCKKNRCNYTRYADDITISGEHEIVKELKPKIVHAIQRYGLVINGSKTHVIHKSGAQSVTGILINKQDDISISYKKSVQNFRALLYTVENKIKQGILRTFEELESQHGSIASLKGYANFISTANPRYKIYLEQVNRIEKLLKEMV